MTNTVADIEKQIADLQNQKVALLNKSKIETIDKIKALINEYDLTAKDLGIKPVKKASKSKPMYANPDFPDQTWTGKGRQPEWVKGFLSLNDSLDKALIK